MAVTGPVLVLNVGSSSLKFQLIDVGTGGPGRALVHETIERVGSEISYADAVGAMQHILDDAGEPTPAAVAHRVVHGGHRFTGPAVIDDEVLAGIEEATHLAPLHNPPALAAIRAARAHYPDVPHVAVFDTAFFADLPGASATYAIDRDLAERGHLRRYGAHGTSHQFVAGEAAHLLGREVADVDLVVLHLGSGASASAIRGGRAVDTSMGLTPLEGLVMGTRGGDLDPGLLLHLQRGLGLDVDDLEELLHHRSGLQGLTGAADVRALMAGLDGGDPACRLAYDVYCHRLRKYLGAYLAVLGGADAVVFTAGVGEHVPRVRADAVAGMEWLGLELDPEANAAAASEARSISTPGSRIAVLVVPTNEELAIARLTAQLLG